MADSVTGEDGRAPGSQRGLAGRPSRGMPLTAWSGSVCCVWGLQKVLTC